MTKTHKNTRLEHGQLPSLLALRGFEAAARHGSFSRAGKELAVTQAAISHQVRGLEDDLGYKLFVRRPRKVTLTEEGHVLMVAVGRALAEIRRALHAIEDHQRGSWLTLSVPPSLAVKWLVPRLSDFTTHHPGIEVRLSATDQAALPGRDDVDLSVRYGDGDFHGYDEEILVQEDVFPVCSPALLEQHPIENQSDLTHHTLLHDEAQCSHPKRLGWQHWAEHFNLDLDTRAGLRFTHSCHAIDAALAGQGIALGRSCLVANDLQAGRLVRPLDVRHPSPFSYYLILPKDEEPAEAVATFIAWLKDSIGKTAIRNGS
ncbi:MAG: transcriptional regulator GcvA [Deltaproteobacteria bacterium]|nr:transcriptional regulator GcvA [Deltaproteobacteria bacterium]